jgi:hypothetical protein
VAKDSPGDPSASAAKQIVNIGGEEVRSGDIILSVDGIR